MMVIPTRTEPQPPLEPISSELEVRIRKRYQNPEGTFNLNVHFRALAGFTIVFGPSGAGKTTLLDCIAGLTPADEGRIAVGGEDLYDSEKRKNVAPWKRRIGYVHQDLALFPHLTVEQNVAYGLRVAKRPEAEIASRVGEALGKVKMSAQAKSKPSKISGGQQQRIALARALVNRPRLLLLDEPLSALDANLRRQMQVELKSLQREVGISFIFVTHDQEEAMVMSDRIALLRSGELEQVATPREIYGRPATAYAAQFIGHTNLLKGEVRGRTVSCGLLTWQAALPDGTALFSLRPENIRLATGNAAPAGTVRVRGRVRHQAFHGATELIRVECGDGMVLVVRTPGGGGALHDVELEFSAADAILVRESPERI